MRTRLRKIVSAWTRPLASFAVIAAAACGSPSIPDRGIGTFSLTGRVTDSVSSAGIAGATVSLGGPVNAGRLTSTDQSGRYTFNGLVPGSFFLNVIAPNYAASQTSVTLSSSAEVNVSLVSASKASLTPPPPVAFDLTGVVTLDDGTPLANVDVWVDSAVTNGSFTRYQQTHSVTDTTGSYRVGFSAVPGSFGHDGAAAYVSTRNQQHFDDDARYLRPATSAPSQRMNLTLHRGRQMAAGESLSITVSPGDPICGNDIQDSYNDVVCRMVTIIVPADGILTIEALPEPGATLPGLEVQTSDDSQERCCENTASIPVRAGMQVLACIELPEGAPRQVFTLRTSLATSSRPGASPFRP